MSGDPRPDFLDGGGACARARAAIHERRDETLDAAHRARLERHLASCVDCAAFGDEIDVVSEALGGLPRLRLSDAALESVLERTVRARRRRVARAGLAGAAAAAVVLAAALILARDPSPPLSEAPDAAALERARSGVELALGVSGRALRRTEEIAKRSASARIAPAFERVPFLNLLTNWNSIERNR